jgi:hypothetical protein
VSSYAVGRSVKWCSCLGKQSGSSSEARIKYEISNSTSRYITKRTEYMFVEKLAHEFHSSIIHKSQKEEVTQMSINEMWSIHTMKFYSVIKSNEALTHASI